jgi:hypothetical protein
MFERFKMGDRVVAIDTIDGLSLKGMAGTIICIDHNSVGIEFDDEFPDGHDCIGGRYGYCRWCYVDSEIEHEAEREDIVLDDESADNISIFLSSYKN